MKFSFNLSNLFSFFRKGKKNNINKEIYPNQSKVEQAYEIRKNFIYSSGMFNIIKKSFDLQNIQCENQQQYDRGVLDTCIGLLSIKGALTKEDIEREYKIGWECATGKILSSYTYVSMVEFIWKNHYTDLTRYINDYNALNLQ